MIKLLQGIFIFLVAIYFFFNIYNKGFLSLLDFNSDSGIFWVFVGLFVLNFIPIIKSIIREIVQNKVNEYSSEAMMEQFKNRVLEDKYLIEALKLKIDTSKQGPIENYKSDHFDSGTKEPEKKWVSFIRQFLP